MCIPEISGNRSIEAELARRVVLRLQRGQSLLSPGLAPVPASRRLITVGVIDVRRQRRHSAPFEQHLPDLVAEPLRLPVELLAGRVDEQRRNEQVVGPVREGARVVGEGLDALLRVSLEHEEGVGEVRVGPGGGFAEQLVDFSLCLRVVLFEIDGEPGVRVARLLAGAVGEGDAGPGRQVAVGAGTGLAFDGAKLVEGLGVDGVHRVDTLLDNILDNHWLQYRLDQFANST